MYDTQSDYLQRYHDNDRSYRVLPRGAYCGGENEVTIFSYIDNVLEHHFETFQDDISELYKKSFDDDYLTPKK